MYQTLQQDKFKDADFKYDNIFFFLKIFRKSKQLNKFEGADFKYDNSFFKFKPKRNKFPARKYPNEAFFVLNVSIFYFCMKVRILKNSRVLILKMAIVFFNSSQKYPNTKFSLKTQNFFFLSETLSELNLFSRT